MLVTTPAHATFPARNGRIAFSPERAGAFEVDTVKPDGTDLRRLVQSSGPSDNPDWSPDGSSIVFQLNHASGPTECSIETMNADGSGVHDRASASQSVVRAGRRRSVPTGFFIHAAGTWLNKRPRAWQGDSRTREPSSGVILHSTVIKETPALRKRLIAIGIAVVVRTSEVRRSLPYSGTKDGGRGDSRDAGPERVISDRKSVV